MSSLLSAEARRLVARYATEAQDEPSQDKRAKKSAGKRAPRRRKTAVSRRPRRAGKKAKECATNADAEERALAPPEDPETPPDDGQERAPGLDIQSAYPSPALDPGEEENPGEPRISHTSESMLEMVQTAMLGDMEREVGEALRAMGPQADVTDALLVSSGESVGLTLADFLRDSEALTATTQSAEQSGALQTLRDSIEFMRVKAAELRSEAEEALRGSGGSFQTILRSGGAGRAAPLLQSNYIEQFLQPPHASGHRPCCRDSNCAYPNMLRFVYGLSHPGQRLDASALVPAREFLLPEEELRFQADPRYRRETPGQCFVCAAVAEAEDVVRASTDQVPGRPAFVPFYRVAMDEPRGFRSAALLQMPGGPGQYILKMAPQQFEMATAAASGLPCLRFRSHMLHEADFRRRPSSPQPPGSRPRAR